MSEQQFEIFWSIFVYNDRYKLWSDMLKSFFIRANGKVENFCSYIHGSMMSCPPDVERQIKRAFLVAMNDGQIIDEIEEFDEMTNYNVYLTHCINGAFNSWKNMSIDEKVKWNPESNN